MIDLRQVAAAFALEGPVETPVSIRERGQVLAWRVGTRSGPVLIKRFWADDELPWQDQLESAMELEQLAVQAGIDTPAPIPPVDPAFGSVARIPGLGFLRAFPYVEHRPLHDDDDIAEWIGTTLALTHRLRPVEGVPDPNWWYGQQPPVDLGQWEAWLRSGESRGKVWAPLLREHLGLVTDLAQRITQTFAQSGPHVESHRDVEPWNILMSGQRPVLIDWDTAGPESALLETAYVITTCAARGRTEPDPALILKSHRAYVAAGGAPITPRSGLLDRRVGYEVSKLASNLGGFFDVQEDEVRTRDRLARLPGRVVRIQRWEEILNDTLTGDPLP